MASHDDGDNGQLPRLSLRRSWIVVTCVLFASALPLVLLLHRLPVFGALSLFANDAFYYLTIAREASVTGWPSFDGVYRTNGFHPLWGFFLIGLTRSGYLQMKDPELVIVRTAYVNLIFLTTASGLIAWSLCRAIGRGWLVLLVLCPGLLWFLQAPVNPLWAAAWSNLNGMESSVELFFFGAALVLIPVSLTKSVGTATPTPYRAARLVASSLCFGLMVLSRLDDVFFLLPLGLVFWDMAGPRNKPLQRFSVALPVVLLLCYVLYNRSTAGVFLPSSGAAKAGIAIGSNLRAALHLVLPNFSGAPPRGASAPFNVFGETYNRVFGMVAPAIVCGVYLFWFRHRRITLIGALCGGVLLKSAYNLLAVDLFYQGSWYYGVDLCVANICVGLAVARILSTQETSLGQQGSTRFLGALLSSGLVVALASNAFLSRLFAVSAGTGQRALFEDRQEIRQMLARAGADRFVEFDDGMLTYATGESALAGLGLALDPEANRARSQGHFLQLAVSRGYSVALATQPYTSAIDLAMARVTGGVRDAQFGMRLEEFDQYRLQRVSSTRDGLTTLYRIVKPASR